MIKKIKNIFGIVYISPCVRIDRDLDDIENEIYFWHGNYVIH